MFYFYTLFCNLILRYFCQIHFSDEMWEKTREGKRCLKSAAVSTIFGNRLVLVSTSVQEPMSIPAECHEL